jgi:UDP-N-acetylmuramyl pentapeptide phosphotransferase/UDP-N-acetylglucosamine-1-phosphate transferase
MLYQCIFLIILFISLISIQSKYSFLLDNPKGERHKINYNKNVPLSGGIYLFLSILLSTFLTKYYNENFLIIVFIFLFLLLGIYSDLKKNFSPRIRLLFQAILIILMVFFLDLKINKTNIFYLDIYISNDMFNLIFTSFCILVLLNGSNFCDGINCNVIGYYLIICLAILYSGLPTPNFLTIEIIISIYAIFYMFNLFKKCFLGDNGVYVISVFMSIYIIQFTNLNTNVSSLIALNLLWYPAFENLLFF